MRGLVPTDGGEAVHSLRSRAGGAGCCQDTAWQCGCGEDEAAARRSGWGSEEGLGCRRLWGRGKAESAPQCRAHSPGCLPRVHGSYEHLWAGQVADALVDLTGGLAERWNLKDVARSSGQQAGTGGTEARTCRQLLGLKERGLISCSVFSPRAGMAVAAAAVTLTRGLPRGASGRAEGRALVRLSGVLGV